ncbi:hypothetical protein IVB14_11990 [Bradyrhizobium sp. 180]|uniref:hypothetical protein n=1 Tax=unclassified Bradyrhizobium TaxID=2631580 RepID=UPI001FF6FEB9|nr:MULTISPECIES: hypothetical protein [unclassified Bradyrhizobium]MCK1423688.1 hypothetical protein [Bradyrhizobium sp. CW12]MCK1491114.1 hypothetical protein [Bradyrhizobium sp. 180]MCK1529274.1 hypothetical protein [Bradyrhizobium sp. 182]MCK1596464.1 hypothetical protein [Bradyrhizobium sp. 164]MCK1620472.1 hypothetical protein [Bradyrhizobium sp. 159]
MKLTLPKVALIAFVAATAFIATSVNAAQYRTYGCEFALFEGCGSLIEMPNQGGRRVVTHRDTSPTYMKQTDPRYSSAMRDAGGSGGGGGGGGSGGR